MKQQICLVPKLDGLGGMVSFQAKLIQGLAARKIPYSFDTNNPNNHVILVIGGTRQLWELWRAKRRGVAIVQRLDGMNWMHKVENTSFRPYMRAEVNNWLLAFIRRHLADHIVYQSNFSRDWWIREHGETKASHSVVYNGVDLTAYTPQGPETPPNDHIRILLVEGHLDGANARGLETALRLAKQIKQTSSRTIELMVVADVSDALKAIAHSSAPDLWITWRGVVPREAIPEIDRSAHFLFSTDINAACPNSVIEAMACGLPVLAYDTGALSELVQKGAGCVVPYGSDYWQLENPVIPPLASAAVEIIKNNPTYRQRARKRAQSTFDLYAMVESYLRALER
ncbi:MAG: glycosyltransferase family 4 protein [Chloroflexota bacterium]|nr:glycosyltransferase family 4 protein [Chloroflexota bacterium]